MSVIKTIFQAILQAICWILPISESAHSSMFHTFAGRVDGSCSAITGVIHIGIAVGIIIAFYKLFFIMSKEFVLTIGDVFKKRIKGSSKSPSRQFMYMTLLSFAPLILWLIPFGKGKFLYTVLAKTANNATLLDDGIFIAVLGVLVILAGRQIALSKNDKNVNIVSSLVIGFAMLFLVPVSGFSLTAGVFAILMILGISKKLSFRYTMVLTVPVLVVKGIVEVCISVVPATALMVVFGLIVSIAISFFVAKLMRWILDVVDIKYFGIYDVSVGLIAVVIGIFQLILK